MKRTRLFILICAMLISLASVGCATNKNFSEIETGSLETGSIASAFETKIEAKSQNIEASVTVKYSEKEIVVFF